MTPAAPLVVELAVRLLDPTRLSAAKLLAVARFTLAAEGFHHGGLSIAVVGARRMSRLHQAHSGISGPTDVLTFDFGGDRRTGRIDGEIIVCAEVARRRCRARAIAGRHSKYSGHGARIPEAATRRALTAELCLYVVHGILHLAGHEDHTPAGFRRMHRREDELLRGCGLGAVFAPDDRPRGRARLQT